MNNQRTPEPKCDWCGSNDLVCGKAWKEERTKLVKERDDYRTRSEALVETLKEVVGFCVAFREDKACWEEHQDVGVLFAKATTAIARWEEGR